MGLSKGNSEMNPNMKCLCPMNVLWITFPRKILGKTYSAPGISILSLFCCVSFHSHDSLGKHGWICFLASFVLLTHAGIPIHTTVFYILWEYTCVIKTKQMMVMGQVRSANYQREDINILVECPIIVFIIHPKLWARLPWRSLEDWTAGTEDCKACHTWSYLQPTHFSVQSWQ